MDVFPYAAFGIVATFFGISCLVLCTCAYLKTHVSRSNGDLPMCLDGELGDFRARDSFEWSSMSGVGGGGGIISRSSVSPNVSSSSSDYGSEGMNPFRNNFLVGEQDEHGGVGGNGQEGHGEKEYVEGDSSGDGIFWDGGLGANECSDMGGIGGGGDGGGDCGGVGDGGD